jgi:hypothetical protein
VCKPGGLALIAMSPLFPTKAILAWHSTSPQERVRLVQLYFELAGGFEPAEFVDRSPGAKPIRCGWCWRDGRCGE